jgi:hypothetical protein
MRLIPLLLLLGIPALLAAQLPEDARPALGEISPGVVTNAVPDAMTPGPVKNQVPRTFFPDNNHSFGFVYSGISGYGLYYQTILGKLRLQLTGLYYFSEDEYEQTTDGCIGVEFQYSLLQATVSESFAVRIYMMLGGAYRSESIDGADSYSYSWDSEEKHLSFGGALGFELLMFQHLSIHYHLGYGYEKQLDSRYRVLGFSGGCGIGFAF